MEKLGMVRYRRIVANLLPLLLSIYPLGCATAPVTGRSQFILVPESTEVVLGLKSYREILGKSKLSQDQEVVAMVRKMGRRIALAANKPEYEWEFNVIQDDKMVNAFALPGGKVAVYTGIFPYTKDEGGLAAVMGHEVAYALVRHGGGADDDNTPGTNRSSGHECSPQGPESHDHQGSKYRLWGSNNRWCRSSLQQESGIGGRPHWLDLDGEGGL